eukprot:g80491.t1
MGTHVAGEDLREGKQLSAWLLAFMTLTLGKCRQEGPTLGFATLNNYEAGCPSHRHFLVEYMLESRRYQYKKD